MFLSGASVQRIEEAIIGATIKSLISDERRSTDGLTGDASRDNGRSVVETSANPV
jgi:hypothetical protein